MSIRLCTHERTAFLVTTLSAGGFDETDRIFLCPLLGSHSALSSFAFRADLRMIASILS